MHIPVLLNEVVLAAKGLECLEVSSTETSTYFFDGTFGRGGHSRALLKEINNLKIFAIDRDLLAIEVGKKDWATEIQAGQLELLHGDLGSLSKISNGNVFAKDKPHFDLMLLDLGVSSPQLDEADRGFSFYCDGPLDMRMNQQQGLTAKEIVNNYPAQELSDMFFHLGEIQYPNQVVGAIIERRETSPFVDTKELSELIESVDGWRKRGVHPATKYFMALRLRVNQELEQLQECLPLLVSQLRTGGRLMVIGFHSLEDRIVKKFFRKCREEGLGMAIHKKPLQASEGEIKLNPRSRSAKLRIFEKGKKRERKKY